ncbi:hypothetical protein E0500_031790 [Streptomyces sp. KM273126]|uniref:hypothetical protein n=1 Tax=Streptomyces sp. KM273126 TaxID=2545247 RepID=UPI00103B064B|nr:hypothetical protein [Streptomyces sp. KM273126]MBA2811780.1 hypothetical protein [Streptomyces sp. KM273126]
MKRRNTIAVLGLLPINILVVGYGLLAVGMTGWGATWNEDPYEPPLAELGAACGAVAIIGGALWWARLRRAAAFQAIPLLVLAALMI